MGTEDSTFLHKSPSEMTMNQSGAYWYITLYLPPGSRLALVVCLLARVKSSIYATPSVATVIILLISRGETCIPMQVSVGRIAGLVDWWFAWTR